MTATSIKYAMAIALMGLLAAPTLAAYSQDELATFQALINFFHPNSPGWTAEYLRSVTQKLEDTGVVTRQQAFDLVRESLRAGVDPELLPDITAIGGTLAQVMGRNNAYGFASALVHALNRGYQAIVDFGLETHTLDAAASRHLRDLAMGGDRYGLQHDAVAAMIKRVKQ
jgi:hypothetical protein